MAIIVTIGDRMNFQHLREAESYREKPPFLRDTGAGIAGCGEDQEVET